MPTTERDDRQPDTVLSYADLAERVTVLEKALREAHDDLCCASFYIGKGVGRRDVNEACERAKKVLEGEK